MDYFYEQFQTKDYEELENKLKILEKIIIVLGIISICLLQIFLFIISVLIFIGIKTYKIKSIIEYEYELTSYDLSINKIINKSKRKEIITLNIKNIISIKDFNNNFNEKFVDASLKDIEIKDKILKIKSGTEIINIKLALDGKLIDIIKRVNPRAFY